jgi:phage anti-repressor protein
MEVMQYFWGCHGSCLWGLCSHENTALVDSGELYTFCDSEKPSSKLYKLRHLYIYMKNVWFQADCIVSEGK